MSACTSRLAWGIIFAAVLAGARPADACTCSGDTKPKEELRTSDAVFTGRAVRRRTVTVRDPLTGQRQRRMREFTFEVQSQWKGALPRRAVVLTGMSSGECGWDFELRVPYIVYARRSHGQLHTTICDRTNRLDRAMQDLKALGPAKSDEA